MILSWRKSIRKALNIPVRTHSGYIVLFSSCRSNCSIRIALKLGDTSMGQCDPFFEGCHVAHNLHVKFVVGLT